MYRLQSRFVAPLFRNKLKPNSALTSQSDNMDRAIYRHVHRGTWIFIPSIPVSDECILFVQVDKKEDTLNTNHNLDTNVHIKEVWKGEGL